MHACESSSYIILKELRLLITCVTSHCYKMQYLKALCSWFCPTNLASLSFVTPFFSKKKPLPLAKLRLTLI